MLGREVPTLANEELNVGSYEVAFDASSLSTGVYFYRLLSGNLTATKSMIVAQYVTHCSIVS